MCCESGSKPAKGAMVNRGLACPLPSLRAMFHRSVESGSSSCEKGVIVRRGHMLDPDKERAHPEVFARNSNKQPMKFPYRHAMRAEFSTPPFQRWSAN